MAKTSVPSRLRTVSPVRRHARPAGATADGYEMANLFPRTTGLPLTVWVSPRGGARNDARIKISLTQGKMDLDNVAVVGIRPKPRLISGKLGADELALVLQWISLNSDALLELWEETIDSVELGRKLKKLPAAVSE